MGVQDMPQNCEAMQKRKGVSYLDLKGYKHSTENCNQKQRIDEQAKTRSNEDEQEEEASERARIPKEVEDETK